MRPKEQIKGLDFTRHAHKRLSQRGLSEAAVKAVLDYGRREFRGDGAIFYFLGNKEYRRAIKRNPTLKHELLQWVGVTLVVSSITNTLVTAYRTKRPKRSVR